MNNLQIVSSVSSVHIQEQIINVFLEDIEPDPKQPREEFDQIELDELSASLRTGQRMPIFLKKHPEKLGKYILNDGERRWRAAPKAGIKKLRAIVVSGTESQLFIQSVIANCARVGLSHIESAKACARIKADTKESNAKVAAYFGQSVQWVEQHLSILRLPDDVLRLMGPPYAKKKRLTYSAALLLVSLPEKDRLELAHEFHANGTKFNKAKLLVEERKKRLRVSIIPRNFKQQDNEHRQLIRFIENVSETTNILHTKVGGSMEEILRNRTAKECQNLITLAEEAVSGLSKIKNELEEVRRKKIIGLVK